MLDVERYRALFPITQHYTFLDHASVAPLGRHVTQAVDAHLARMQTTPFELLRPDLELLERETRQRAARLIGATHPDELGVVPHAEQALNTVVDGLPLHAGDTVLTLDVDDQPTVRPWLRLAERGIVLRSVPARNGGLDPATLERRIDRRTRVVAIGSVVGATGFRNDLSAIGALCRRRGIVFVVDATNSLGALPFDVQASQIDVLMSGGEKWLLGGTGAGLLYVRQDLIDTLPPDAARFNTAGVSYEALVALHASLGLLLEVGADAIGERVLDLAAALIGDLRDRGYRVRASNDYYHHSGLVVVDLPDAQAARLRLAAKQIIVAARGDTLRLSPHFYNTEAEVLRVGAVLGT